MEVSVEPVSYRFREPLRTAFGTLDTRDVLLLRLRGADGVEGVGEAAPLEPYDGVSTARAAAALEAYRPALAASDGDDLEAVLAACRERDPLPQALAAVDVALWDLAGRRARRPVAALLAGEHLDASATAPVALGMVVGGDEPAAAAGQALAAARAGFRCVKVKVGTGDDRARVAAVRAAVGPEVAIRVDANGAWSVEGALAALEELVPLGLELCEEPVHGVAALREVRAASTVPVAMDETAAKDGAVGSGATDLVCLKVARHGGIGGTLAAARAARAAGSEAYVASILDGPVGIAAAVHVAAALGVDRPCGLATLGLFEDVEVPPALEAFDGAIPVPRAPGLGVGP